MRLNKQITIITLISVSFTLGIGLAANINAVPKELDAYDVSSTSLTGTIDLNDATASEIRAYYSNLNGLDASERSGTNLLKNLKPILSNNQKYYSYDKGSKIWQLYEIIDRDWEKSPATSLSYGTYDAENNIITGYKYGSSASNSKNNPYIHALYINRELDNQTTAWDDHGQTAWGINREHIWAKSHGFDTLVSEDDTGGARGDPMHLWAGNGWANHEHLNYFFAFVDKNRAYSDAGNKYDTVYDNLTGYSLNAGGNEKVFEPQDCDKGDIARSIFYMVARYNNYANETEGIDSNNPNLVMLNNLSENGRTGTSTATDPYGMGLLSDLLAWNKLDPVDEFEIHRNNLLYKNYTNNRNPFIDFPEWADAIWGTADLDGTNYNANLVGNANPSTDTIAAPVTEFELSVPRVRLELDETGEIWGLNTEGAITWSIDDESIATIDKTSTVGTERVTVTAISSGKTTITATCGSKTVTGAVIVTTPDPINYGTEDSPLSVEDAKALIDKNSPTVEKMYVKGIVSSYSYSDEYDNYNIWLQNEDGSEPHEFELYHAVLDENVTGLAADKEVVAYGYGQKYSSTYELSPNNNFVPRILSIKNPGDKTPKELVEEQLTSTSLAYNYDKDDAAELSVTDVITKAETGVSGTSYSDWTHTEEASNITYKGNSAGGNSSVQLRSSNSNSGLVITSNPGSKKAKAVTVKWEDHTAAGRTLEVYGSDTAYTAATDLYDNDKQGTLLGTIVMGTSESLTITGDYEYIGLKSKKDAMYLSSISIDYDYIGTTYEYSNVCIRFGGVISQSLWNELDTNNHIIQGFGVMIATDDVIGKDMEIKDFYESASLAENEPDVSEEIVDYFVPVANLSIMGIRDNNYFWNLRYSVADLKTTYVAAAYIKTSTGYVFYRQEKYSAKTLAQDYLDNRGYDESIAAGSLKNLADI